MTRLNIIQSVQSAEEFCIAFYSHNSSQSKKKKKEKKMDLNSSNSNSTTPSVCAMGCGFYGTKENKNMCSKCYKDFLKSSQLVITIPKSSPPDSSLRNPPNPSVVLVHPTPQSTASHSETSTAVTSGSPTASSSRVKNRCQHCNKKVGLTGFKCRCGDLFCGMHRYPKEHSCTFDFKKIDREILLKNNPLIKPDKLVDKI